MAIPKELEGIFQQLFAGWEEKYAGRSPYFGITDGNLGVTLYYAWLGKTIDDGDYADKVVELVNLTISRLNNTVNTNELTLGAGLSGLGWFLMHLSESGLTDAEDNEAILEGIDALVIQRVQHQIASGNFDLVRGANGLLFYLLKRRKLDRTMIADAYCRKIMDEAGDATYTWWHQIRTEGDKELPGINFGIPHGICGTLLLLLKVKKDLNYDVDEVIENTIQFMLSHVRNSPNGIEIPAWSDNYKTRISPGRAGWCSGNLSLGYAILLAGVMLKNNDLSHIGSELLNTAIHDIATTDNTLCHGLISSAHIYYRIHHLTGEEKYLQKYQEYKELAINRFLNDYISYKKQAAPSFFFENASLLYGFSGFALSLLCMNNKLIPTWDECLLL